MPCTLMILGVGESSFRRDPNRCPSRGGKMNARLQECLYAAHGPEFDTIETEPFEDLITLQCYGIDWGVKLAIWEELAIEKMRNHGVPPTGMIGVDDERFSQCAWSLVEKVDRL